MSAKFGFLFLYTACFSQSDSGAVALKVSGYADIYYCYDFSNPGNHLRPDFLYSYNRHNELTANLAFARLSYEERGVRSNFALMAGTYAQYNLAAEPFIFQHVMEASAGVRLSEKKRLWLDAGIMPSHLGFESATGKDCWTLTRSMQADNSPYYETGVKISGYSSSGKWYLAAFLLNGWQRIQRQPGNQTPAFGTQVTYKPDPKLTLNWSTFEGNEFPDSVQRWRYFHNLYCIVQVTNQFGLTAGFDIGIQQASKHSSTYDVWYSPIVLAKLNFGKNMIIAARMEYFDDQQEVIVNTGTPEGFQTLGYSLNYDFTIRKNCVWRLEGRAFHSKDQIFINDGKRVSQNYAATTSLAVWF